MYADTYIPGWVAVAVGVVGIIISGWLVYVAADSSESALQVSFLDVGQGDATLIETPDGTQVLIDAGRANNGIGRELSDQLPVYDRSLDLVIGSHADSDHIGGFPTVLKEYRADHVVVPARSAETAAWDQYLRSVQTEKRKDGARLHRLHAGRVIRISDNVYLLALFPDRRHMPADANNSSLVLKLVYGNTSALLTGDISDGIERFITARSARLLEADILKLAHHGSKTASSRMFLSAVSPAQAVISAGTDNRHGHPHEEVLDRLKEMDIKTLCTCNRGTITFTSDGREFTRLQ